jgi:hypothetical protein
MDTSWRSPERGESLTATGIGNADVPAATLLS